MTISPSSPGALTTSPAASSSGFAELFDALLSRPEATAVLQAVARAVGAALATEGYLPGEWATCPSPQFDYVREVQLLAPFRDPTTNVGYMASVRLFAVSPSDDYRACVWVDLCRLGETHRDVDSVCQSVLETTWPGALPATALLREMELWAHPDNAATIATRAGELVADLTTILAP